VTPTSAGTSSHAAASRGHDSARIVDSASRHGVDASVANPADSTVHIDVEDGRTPVEAFLGDVSGPRGASRAHEIEHIAEVSVSADLVGFVITRT